MNDEKIHKKFIQVPKHIIYGEAKSQTIQSACNY
jgi:hypothetical protein